MDDDGESVKLTFDSPLPDGVSAGTTDETTVSITDDDVPAVEVSFEHSSYTVAESDDASTTSEKENEVTVTVTLDAEPERTVEIPLILTNQGASDADYSLSATSVTFGPTETSKTFTFTATQDTVDDDGESVKLTFDSPLPGGVSTGTIDETTVSITDDDAPSSLTVNFKKSGYTVTEGSIEEIVLTLDDDPERTVTIPLSWSNEDGASDSDHNGVPTDVTFNAGETEKSFEFSAVSDRIGDQGETVSIKLGAPPSGVTKGTTSETVVTIEDVAPQGSTTVSFGADTYGVSEGSFTTITVVMSHAPGSDATIPIMATNQGDTSNSDYLLSATSVIFGPTDTSKTFTFTATQDSVDDDEESVDLGFGTLPTGISEGAPSETTVSITDDDVPAVEVSFGSATYPVDEGDTETVTVTLSAAPEREVVVPIDTTGEDGASSADYSLSATSVTFGPTDTSKTFTFTAIQDSVDDDGESVDLTFGSPLPEGVSTGSVPETTVSINDDDETVMEVSFEKSTYSVDEGHEVEVMVRLDPAPDHQMDIQLKTTNMNGTSDDDYNGVPSMLIFERGDTEKTFTFVAELDDENDDGEAVEVSFVALPAMVRKGEPSKTIVSLRDNGGPSQDGITCIDNNRANIVTVLSERGEISSLGEVDTWVIPGVDPFRTYLVEILGADSDVDVWGQDVGGSLTLADPHPVSLYHEDGRVGNSGYNSAPGDFGTGRNSRFIFVFSTFGDFVLKVKSGESAGDQGTGSYHLLVRYDNYCIVGDDGSIVFPFEGGPEGYAFDIRDDTDTRFHVNERYSTDLHRRPYFAGGHLLGDNWGSEPDEDWFRFKLEGDTEYEVSLEGTPQFPVEHRLTRPRIVGIFDENGQLFHEGEAGSGTDTSVGLTFQSGSSGLYYLGVGSNPGDRTGVYSFHVRQTESNNAGHAATNNSPTGGPGITGLPRIGEVLTATTSGIADADGLENSSFSYQWVRHDPLANTDTDIPGATGSTYTVTRQDQDRAIKVRVEFTDDGGNDEELTSFAFLISPPVNTRAAGQPTITGTLEVGQTLTADTSRISDADRKDNATFGYRWIAGDSDIQNATGMSHTLTEDEEGLAIRVSVTFTDDAGNETTLTSSPTEPVEPAAKGSSDPDATRAGAVDLGDITSLAKARYPTYSVNGVDDVVDYFTFTITEPKRVQIGIRQLDADANLTLEHEDGTVIEHKSKPGEEHVAMYPTLLEGAYYIRVDAAEEGHNEYRMAHGVSEPNPDRVAELREKVRPLNRATGSPAIVGTAQVGEPLTADTSGISDADGLENVTFSFQWVVSDGGADVDIAGATDSSYTLVAADEGLTIKVRVNFIDDAGNDENLTSAATDKVSFAVQQQEASNSPATGQPTITGTAQVGETLTADSSGIADADGLTNVSYSYQWIAGESDIGGATGSTYTLTVSEQGKTIKVKVTLTDDAGNEATLTSAATDEVEAAPHSNSPATGQPTISGTARVGETLTMDTSGIADDDGLVNATYRYQWVANDGGTDADISGETGATYTLVADDEGKTIKVKVTVTDDATWDDPNDGTITGYVILRRNREIHPVGTFVTIAGDTGSADATYTDATVEPDKQYVYRIKAINEHGKVSEESDWVRADTPAVPVPDKPTGLSAVVSHDTVTLTWDDPQDDSITGYVILRRDREIHLVGTFVTLTGDTGSADTTYTDDTVEPDKQYVYRIKAINEHGEVSEESDWVRGFTPAAPAPAGSPAQ